MQRWVECSIGALSFCWSRCSWPCPHWPTRTAHPGRTVAASPSSPVAPATGTETPRPLWSCPSLACRAPTASVQNIRSPSASDTPSTARADTCSGTTVQAPSPRVRAASRWPKNPEPCRKVRLGTIGPSRGRRPPRTSARSGSNLSATPSMGTGRQTPTMRGTSCPS